MENILKAADNFQVTSVEEQTINETLFLEFMNKVTIWDYFAITKNHYLALSEAEKREKINKYYFDMKSRSIVGKNIFVCLVSLVWKCLLNG